MRKKQGKKVKPLPEGDQVGPYTSPTLQLEWKVPCPQVVKDAFDRLAWETDRERAEAATVILKYLEETILQGPEDKFSDTAWHIIGRLMAGLYADQLYAREGYYSTLQAVLQLHPSTVPATSKLFLRKFAPETNLKNQETVKTNLVGEVLYYGALIRSGHVSSLPAFTNQMVQRLITLKENVDYLDVMATQFLVDLLEKSGDLITCNMEAWKHLKAYLERGCNEPTPSYRWLCLVMMRTLSTELIPHWWFVSLVNPGVLATSIMSTVSCLPNVHPLLGEAVRSLAPKEQDTKNPLISFWKKIEENHLTDCAVKDLQLILNILQLVVPKLRTAEEVSQVLTRSIVALLMTSVSLHGHDLSTAARGMASALLHLVASHEHDIELQIAVVRALVIPPGSIRFDRLTGTKLLTQMMSHFSFPALKALADLLRELTDRALEVDNVWEVRGLAFTLKNLIFHRSFSSDDYYEWRVQQLKTLMKVALFCPSDVSSKHEIRTVFARTMAHCGEIHNTEKYSSLLGQIVHQVNEELQLKQAEGKKPLSVSAAASWEQVQKKLAVLQSDNMKDTVPSKAFQLLYGQMALHLFFDPRYAREVIAELNSCYKEMMKSVNQDNSSEEELYWVDVVTELLLSFMGCGEQHLRSVARGAFGLLCPLATTDTIALILDILDMAKAKQLVSDHMVEDEGEELEMEIDEEDVGDKDAKEEDGNEGEVKEEYGKKEKVEEKDEEDDKMEEEEGKEQEEDTDEDENEDSESSDDDCDSDLDEKETNEEKEFKDISELKKKLLAAMDTSNFDIGDIDMDSMPVSVQDRLDKRLGYIFAEYRRRRYGWEPKLDGDEKNILHFQNRACDLLLLFIRSKPKMSLVMNTLVPLFKAAELARQTWLLVPLQKRIMDLIDELMKQVNHFERDLKFNEALEIWNNFFTASLELPDHLLSTVEKCYNMLLSTCMKIQEEDNSASGSDSSISADYLQHLDKLLATELSAPKVLAYLTPCATIQCDGLKKVAQVMADTAFNSAVKPYRRVLGLQGLQRLYKNKVFLEKKSQQLEREIAGNIIKMLTELSTPGIFLKRVLQSLLELILVLFKHDESAGGRSVFKWDLMKAGLVSARQNVAKRDINSFLHVYRQLRHALDIPINVCEEKQCPVSVKSKEKQKAKEKKEKMKNKRKQWLMKTKEKREMRTKDKEAQKQKKRKKFETRTRTTPRPVKITPGILKASQDISLVLSRQAT